MGPRAGAALGPTPALTRRLPPRLRRCRTGSPAPSALEAGSAAVPSKRAKPRVPVERRGSGAMVGDEAPQEVVSASRSRGWLPAGRHWSGSLRFKGTGVRGGVVDLITMRVGLLMRRRWRATLLLALVAGLAGGVAMAAFAVGRRTSTAFDRFSLTPHHPICWSRSAHPSWRRSTTRRSSSASTTTRSRRRRSPPSCRRSPPLDGWPTSGSRRHRRRTRTDVAGERGPRARSSSRRRSTEHPSSSPAGAPTRPPPTRSLSTSSSPSVAGFTVGDELDLTFWAADEMGATAGEGDRFSGPTARVTVVGIERNVRDLVSRVGTASRGSTSIACRRDRAWGRARRAPLASPASPSSRWVVTSTPPRRRSTRPSPDACTTCRSTSTPTTRSRSPTPSATRPEARSCSGRSRRWPRLGFSGQAVSRQSRREWLDGPALRALGMSTRDADASAILRGAVTGSIAAVVAVCTAVALSTLGPFGMAGRAEVRTGAPSSTFPSSSSACSACSRSSRGRPGGRSLGSFAALHLRRR